MYTKYLLSGGGGGGGGRGGGGKGGGNHATPKPSNYGKLNTMSPCFSLKRQRTKEVVSIHFQYSM